MYGGMISGKREPYLYEYGKTLYPQLQKLVVCKLLQQVQVQNYKH